MNLQEVGNVCERSLVHERSENRPDVPGPRSRVFFAENGIFNKVSSERSFIDLVRQRFQHMSASVNAFGDTNSSQVKLPNSSGRKRALQKSGPDFTQLADASDDSTSLDLKKGLSCSDSMIQLSGRVHLIYEQIRRNNVDSNSSKSPSSSSSSSESSIYSSCEDLSHSTTSSSTSSSGSLAPPEPPDGGWGWIIVVAAFFVHLITDGVPVAFGIFIEDLFEDFNVTLSMTSWVGSFAFGIPCLAAPVASILISKFGCRNVCIVGGFVSAIGCTMSFFSRTLFQLVWTFGVFSGMGCSLSSTAALIIVSLYFEDQRATATGLSIAGSGVGAFIFAPLVERLISLYTWRGAMLILSGVFANLIVCGALMRPIETQKERKKRQLLVCMENFAKESGFKLPQVYLNSEDKRTDARIHLLRKLLTSPVFPESSTSSSSSSLVNPSCAQSRKNQAENQRHKSQLKSETRDISSSNALCPDCVFSSVDQKQVARKLCRQNLNLETLYEEGAYLDPAAMYIKESNHQPSPGRGIGFDEPVVNNFLHSKTSHFLEDFHKSKRCTWPPFAHKSFKQELPRKSFRVFSYEPMGKYVFAVTSCERLVGLKNPKPRAVVPPSNDTAVGISVSSTPEVYCAESPSAALRQLRMNNPHLLQNLRQSTQPTNCLDPPTANRTDLRLKSKTIAVKASATDVDDSRMAQQQKYSLAAFRDSITHLHPLHSRTKRSVFHQSVVSRSSAVDRLRAALSMPDLVSAQKGDSNSEDSGSYKPGHNVFHCHPSCLRRVKTALWRHFTYAVDLSLLKGLQFNSFLLSTLLLFFWCNVAYFFLAIFAVQRGTSYTMAAILYSIMGASDMVGEIVFGWTADQEWCNIVFLYFCGVLVCGVSTMLVPMATNFPALVCYSIFFGFTMAANDSLCTIFVIEFAGLSRLVSGLGICLFCQGIAMILGPPFIGFIIDATGSEAVAFAVGGAGIVAAALVMIPIIVQEQRRRIARRRRRALHLQLKRSGSTASFVGDLSPSLQRPPQLTFPE
uniref:Monocarboxylate transporter 9 n=1 Tax=Schistocephalus solidus TaxID=70667 RepID=A0A0X3PI87_SCHSO